MSSTEIPKAKNSNSNANKKKSLPIQKKNNDLTCIKNDLRDIKIDIREFRADIYCEMKDASTVYSILKNGNTRLLSSIQTLMDFIEDNFDDSNKKIAKELKKNRQFLICSILTMITFNLLALIYIIKMKV